MQKNNFYIITGGPGSGKTTIIDALNAQGYPCVKEVGRQIIQEQIKIEGDALHWKNQIKFCDLMLSRSIYTFEHIEEEKKAVFFDRGIPELMAYCRLIKAPIPDYLINATRLFRYNEKVFITPPWEEIYQNDHERKQSWEEAVETYHKVADAYVETGYQLIEIPKCAPSERTEFILQQISNEYSKNI